MYGNAGIMLDLETLGTEPGCGITEIGYCTFNYKVLQHRDMIQMHGQHHTISLEDNLRHRMTISPDTINWWEYEQHQGLPKFSVRTMQATLALVAHEMTELWKKGIRDVWAKPALFDIPILCAAMDKLGIERPLQLQKQNFRYWQCFATLRRVATAIAPELKVHVDFDTPVIHNALADAADQAVQTNIILTVLPVWRSSQHAVDRLTRGVAESRATADAKMLAKQQKNAARRKSYAKHKRK